MLQGGPNNGQRCQEVQRYVWIAWHCVVSQGVRDGSWLVLSQAVTGA